jgi:hypothetical protein
LLNQTKRNIMEAKTKAKELVDSFVKPTKDWHGHSWEVKRKQCAILTCDEVIINLHWLADSINFDKAILFWEEVKQQINKL